MTARDLVQQRMTLPSGDTCWRPAPLVQAAKNGSLAVLDGMHRVNAGSFAVLHRYCKPLKFIQNYTVGCWCKISKLFNCFRSRFRSHFRSRFRSCFRLQLFLRYSIYFCFQYHFTFPLFPAHITNNWLLHSMHCFCWFTLG